VTTDSGSEESPYAAGRITPLRTAVGGCLVSVACFILCLIPTHIAATYAVKDMPLTEPWEAFNADITLMSWCCCGMVLSLPISVMAGVLSAWWASRGVQKLTERPQVSSPPHDTAR
jgi:hypothetical protein